MKAKQKQSSLDEGFGIPALRYHDSAQIHVTINEFVNVIPMDSKLDKFKYNTVLNIPKLGIHVVNKADLEFTENS